MDLTPFGDAGIFVDPRAYANPPHWHDAATRLRRTPGLPRIEVPGFVPFRAVTRHAEVEAIERNHEVFHNTPDVVLAPEADNERRRAIGAEIRSLVQMDGKEHRDHRKITNDWFKPASLRKTVESSLRPLAKRFVDRMVDLGSECDFARDVALYYPLHVIMRILGVPESDEPRMLRLTQQIFGAQDPDVAAGEDQFQVFVAGLMDMGAYFQGVANDRRAHPTSDVASTVANATIDGKPLGDLQIAGYYTILAAAGHDTTSSSLAGGLEALIRNPEQMRALRDDVSLLPNAIDEIIRWVTPVRHFLRQAQADARVGEVEIAKGEWVLLSYLSANRDETVFDEPFRFDVRRANADRHLAFGLGVHFCLGAHLARMELQAFLEELLPRLDSIELAGEPELMQTTFVGGPKRLPIRYRIR